VGGPQEVLRHLSRDWVYFEHRGTASPTTGPEEESVQEASQTRGDGLWPPGDLSDEDLTALALAADPSEPLSPDAVPWNGVAAFPQGLLPDWYMPRPTASRRGRGTTAVIVAIVVGILVIDAFGLCITSGFLSLA
jgi:hypothetical protein